MYLHWRFHGEEMMVAGAWGRLAHISASRELGLEMEPGYNLRGPPPCTPIPPAKPHLPKVLKYLKSVTTWGQSVQTQELVGTLQSKPQQSYSEDHIYFCMCVACAHVCMLVSLCLWCVHMEMLFVCVYAYIWYMCVYGPLLAWVHIFVSVWKPYDCTGNYPALLSPLFIKAGPFIWSHSLASQSPVSAWAGVTGSPLTFMWVLGSERSHPLSPLPDYNSKEWNKYYVFLNSQKVAKN